MGKENSLAIWADKPYELLEIPSRTLDITSHSAIHCASEMAHAHNCLLRGLNSIVLQAPFVTDSSQSGYDPVNVQDLMKYVEAWVSTVEHHHHTEETCMFPLIEEFAKEPGVMQGPYDQHAQFHPGLEKLLAYAQNTSAEDYRWESETGMKIIIDSFAESLVRHLHDEIRVFLSLDRLESQGLRKCFDEGERVAKAQGNMRMLYEVFPLVMGCCDRTHDGGNKFPPLPAPVPYAIHYWFSRRHSGAWRFNPCDFWGTPTPLQFLPENRKS